MVSILNFVVVFVVLVATFFTLRYFVFAVIDDEADDLIGKALRIMGCVMIIASVSWAIAFIWLAHTGFVRMKISLWVREIYFTIQDGRLLELLLR